QNGFAWRDGLRLSAIDFPTAQEVWGLESIDILKGPASVLYGQIAPGGLANYQSKLPTGKRLFDTQIVAGSYGLMSAAIDIGGNLDEAGEWQFRMPALYRQSDDPIDFVERSRLFAAPSVTWQPSDKFDVTVFTQFQEDEFDRPVSLPVSGTIEPNANGRLPLFGFLGEPGLGPQKERLSRLGYIFNYRWSEGLTYRQVARYSSSRNEPGSIRAAGFQADQRTLNRSYAGDDLFLDSYAIDNQLEAVFESGSLNHRVLIGIDYFAETYNADFVSGSVAPIDAFAPVYGAEVTVDPNPFVYKEKSDQAHPYLQYRLTVADKIVVVGGLGYGWTRANGFVFGDEINDETVDAVVGNAALMYTTENGLSIYGSYAESFRPQLGISPLEDGSRPDPSEGDQLELGLKWAPTNG
ncbi:MAG: TonB-dependent receptor, partial [Pseudomonadota bacterium]